MRCDTRESREIRTGCADLAVDDWLRKDAVAADRQAGVVVQVANDGGRVVGCYRLSSFQVQARRPVPSLRPCRARMPILAVGVSRLAVDRRWQGQGLGASLMRHALDLAALSRPPWTPGSSLRTGRQDSRPGSCGRFGFRAFDSDPRWSHLPMRDVEATISARATPPQRTTVTGRPTPDR